MFTFPADSTRLLEFEPTTEEEILHIITTHGVKCSPEDPVPVKVLKENLNVFIPIWTELVNFSLEVGDVESLKSSAVLPLIKLLDQIMDKDIFRNCSFKSVNS